LHKGTITGPRSVSTLPPRAWGPRPHQKACNYRLKPATTFKPAHVKDSGSRNSTGKGTEVRSSLKVLSHVPPDKETLEGGSVRERGGLESVPQEGPDPGLKAEHQQNWKPTTFASLKKGLERAGVCKKKRKQKPLGNLRIPTSSGTQGSGPRKSGDGEGSSGGGGGMQGG